MDIDEDIYLHIVDDRKDAFKTLFYNYYDSLVRYCLNIIDNQSEAEDIVQDVFAYFWSHRKTIVITGSVKSYLFTSVKYQSVNFLKHKILERDHHPYIVEFLENVAHEEYSEEENRQIDEIRKALLELPEQCRLVFTKAVLEGKSYKEIAAELSISVNTVKSHVQKAYHNIRSFVDHSDIRTSLLYLMIFKNFY